MPDLDLKTVAVTIPLYKEQLNPCETIALKQCLKILGKHPIIAISPVGLKLEYLKEDIEIKTFDPIHFQSAKTFSRFQLTDHFYSAFAPFRYILMYQLDAFVFRDELLDWCSRDYDFIGAPWINVEFPDSYRIRKTFPLWMKIRWSLGLDRGGRVGNGGFSLRKISSCTKVIKRLSRFVDQWPHNQDVFWAIAAPNFFPDFNIPPIEKAMEFAFELSPRECFQRIGGRTPFGCHAWMKYDVVFWRNIFSEYGVSI